MHLDRNEETFKLYEKLYKGRMPWDLFDFENKKRDGNGYYVLLKTESELENIPAEYKIMVEKYGGKLKLSGDADFGMKKGITLDVDSYKFVSTKFNKDPEELMHENSNFSLMVVNGGMNCKKGLKSGYRDIFPCYLAGIAEYYSCKDLNAKSDFAKQNLCKLSSGGRPKKGMLEKEKEERKKILYDRFEKEEVPALCCFLDSFDGFEDYCKKTYFWGRITEENEKQISNCIKEIKNFGNNYKIINKDNIEEYRKLANTYWTIRDEIISNNNQGEVNDI